MLPYCPGLRSGNASWAKLAHDAPPLSAALLWLHLKMRNTSGLNSALERNLCSESQIEIRAFLLSVQTAHHEELISQVRFDTAQLSCATAGLG